MSDDDVKTLKLPVRVNNSLFYAGIETIDQLVKTPLAELSKAKLLGVGGLKHIRQALNERGFEGGWWTEPEPSELPKLIARREKLLKQLAKLEARIAEEEAK